MNPITISRRAANIGLFAFFLIFAIAAYSVTASFPSPLLPGYPGSAMFPRLVLVTMGLVCVVGLGRAITASAGATEQGFISIPIGPVSGVILYLLAFAALLYFLGTEIAVFAAVAGCLWARWRKPLIAMLAGIAAVLVVYFVFVQALSVHLPLLFLPRYMFLGL